MILTLLQRRNNIVPGFCTIMKLYLPARTERIQRIRSGGQVKLHSSTNAKDKKQTLPA